jgi:hypothetical protein
MSSISTFFQEQCQTVVNLFNKVTEATWTFTDEVSRKVTDMTDSAHPASIPPADCNV